MSRSFTFTLLTALVFSGCSCSEDPNGQNGQDSAPNVNTDGGPGSDGGGNGSDGGDPGNDGGGNGGDGSVLDTGSDAGNPFEEPLSAFCSGMGSVVVVGEGSQCAGEIAENTFRFALCACETILVQSTLDIDAFDSSLGTYGSTLAGGGTNVIADGQLGINDALVMDGKLTVLGSAFTGDGFSVGSQSAVSANLYTSGTATQANSSTMIGRNAFIGGNVNGRYTIVGDLFVSPASQISAGTTVGGMTVRRAIPQVTPCACSNAEILDVGALTAFGATHNDNAVENVITSTTWANGQGPDVITLPCGRYYLTEINHPRGLTIRATDRTVLYVDGDMIIGGGINLVVEDEGEIDLFVRGNLTVQASASFGDRDAPSRVRTYVGGTETIRLGASSQFGGNLYAPRAEVQFGASADLYGALFARRAVFSGSASVHFDRAIRSAGQTCEMPPPDGGVADGGGVDGAIDNDGGPIDSDGAVDAGVPPDTGVVNPDAGPAECSGCFECGSQACIGGQCQACRDDLDCCAPYVCGPDGLCILPI